MERYELTPKVMISYDRFAFFGKNDSDFRLTFDKNVFTRREELDFGSDAHGKNLLNDGEWLMEAKGTNTFPLWFVHFLSQNKINQNSFSKYGNEFLNYRAG